eukprot:6202946-Pleurochrysis_carterae.AAC.1
MTSATSWSWPSCRRGWLTRPNTSASPTHSRSLSQARRATANAAHFWRRPRCTTIFEGAMRSNFVETRPAMPVLYLNATGGCLGCGNAPAPPPTTLSRRGITHVEVRSAYTFAATRSSLTLRWRRSACTRGATRAYPCASILTSSCRPGTVS